MDCGLAYETVSTAPSVVQTVVVIDDDPVSVKIARRMLEIGGYEVIPCPPVPTARSCIATLLPAAIVLDVHMPGLDGIQFFRDLRADPATQAIPVIFATCRIDDVRRRLPDYKMHGAQLLAKPFDIDALLAMVEKVVPLMHTAP